jgi:O-antigen/teichoic acid export membrane protein
MLLLVPVFGDQYSAARPLIWPLAAAGGLYAFSRFGVAITVAGNRSSLAASIDVSGMVVAALAYLVFIPEHGAAGAAVGSLLGYGVAALASSFAVLWMGKARRAMA